MQPKMVRLPRCDGPKRNNVFAPGEKWIACGANFANYESDIRTHMATRVILFTILTRKMRISTALRTLTLFALSTSVSADLLSDVETAFENAVDCASCHALLIPLQTLAHLGNDAFVDTIVTVCKTFQVSIHLLGPPSCSAHVKQQLEDDDVCQGAIGLQGPILAHALRQISATGQTATKFCDAVFGLCQPPAVNPFNVPFPTVAPTNPKTFTSTGKTPFLVVHISDVHIDRMYTVRIACFITHQ